MMLKLKKSGSWIQCFLFLITLICLSSGTNYTLHLHSNSQFESRCLDGSPAGLYFWNGTSNNLLIYFQGGGSCVGSDLSSFSQNCYQRSSTDLGSSLNYPASKNLDKYSVLSTNQTTNPLFYNWHKVFIPYCDGSLHQGYRKEPLSYKAKDLYFRGEANTKTHLNFLNQMFDLYKLPNVIMTGTSAGGMACLLWSNYVQAKMSQDSKLVVMPDSGIFIIDFVNPFTNRTPAIDQTTPLFKTTNVETTVPLQECVEVHPDQLDCFHGGRLAEFVIPPVFVVQSEYDTWGIGNILELKCAPNTKPSNFSACNNSEIQAIESYRSALQEAIGNYSKKDSNGIWAISCAQHGFLDGSIFYDSDNYLVPALSGQTILETLTNFLYNSGSSISFDSSAWPQNKKCNGLKQFLTY